MARQARAIQFITTKDGCYIPLSHALNKDGYFRKRWGKSSESDIEMFHRFIWRAKKGEIPDSYEINHLCGCRACANVDHMECIPGTEHAIKTNESRYVERQKKMIQLIEQGKTASEMMQITGESKDAIYQYRSRYNKQKLPVMKKGC